MTVDLTKLSFYSGANYMKRHFLTGSHTVTLGAFGSTVTQIINHNLGYIPIVHVSYEATGDGTIWPSEKISKYTESSLTGTYPQHPPISYWTTTTALSIQLVNNTSPTATGDRTLYWVIYLDYGNV